MAIEKYIIDKSDLTTLLRGEDLAIQPKGNIKGFCVEIEGNLTNGDVIKAMFPNAKIERGLYGISGTPLICLNLGTRCDVHEMSFVEEWWNAPYKTESEG